MADGGLGVRLLSAVRAGDAERVQDLLDEGADPDTVDENGLPALCVAVAAYDAPVAQALVEGGAAVERVLPDGTTPLWRAIDGGSHAVFEAVLGRETRMRLPESRGAELIALASEWYGTGVTEVLRRRTGAAGPVTTARVEDDLYDWVDEVSLGGLVVRAGHGAILSTLEAACRVQTPVDELIARAVRQPDEEHVDWAAACWVLVRRRDDESFPAVVAQRHHPDPVHRRFVADYLRTRSFCDVEHPRYGKNETAALAAWSAEETDSAVLAKVLGAFTEYEHPGLEAAGLRHVDHQDPRVRREVPYAFLTDGGPLSPAGREALRALVRDPDTEVRLRACSVGASDEDLRPEITRALLRMIEDPDPAVHRRATETLATSPDRTPAVSDALMAMLDADDQLVRLEAAWGLARRDDPRTEEAYARVGPLGPGFEHDHRPGELPHWRWRRKDAEDAAFRNGH
ncbi:HEAT repeat domain-containing protein [Streptomyces sp. Je 1-369]|uniref:HEAT repeat domain-containing protein n=1 Tax=Streptomyces sp. Je 1-369 TaxID=2966192 RepID=UPI0022860A14|nr:HEAT repeat domain-containing protein [Streptomyces sp. Je 1-369]WAL99730.1 HEAT repeat domain-containing protein [Streptomyces sp. Je 1-369]